MDLFTLENSAALLTLTAMEVVLGIDNIVFITILCGQAAPESRARIRTLGMALAVLIRIGLLFCISWIMGLTKTLFSVAGTDVSGKSLILLLGGLFLVAKATYEIHHKIEDDAGPSVKPGGGSAGWIIVQIILLDLVFSLDSVITAVGMVKDIRIMIAAVIIAVGVMIAFAGTIGAFVERHPALKMLALAFLVLIGVMLILDGVGHHMPKGYVYFAMAFSLGVELLNMRAGSRAVKRA